MDRPLYPVTPPRPPRPRLGFTCERCEKRSDGPVHMFDHDARKLCRACATIVRKQYVRSTWLILIFFGIALLGVLVAIFAGPVMEVISRW